jgi:hypothetical protein
MQMRLSSDTRGRGAMVYTRPHLPLHDLVQRIIPQPKTPERRIGRLQDPPFSGTQRKRDGQRHFDPCCPVYAVFLVTPLISIEWQHHV